MNNLERDAKIESIREKTAKTKAEIKGQKGSTSYYKNLNVQNVRYYIERVEFLLKEIDRLRRIIAEGKSDE